MSPRKPTRLETKRSEAAARETAAAVEPITREYGDVVTLVRSLGDTAVDEFLNGLGVHFQALLEKEPGAASNLARYLHECAMSAVVLRELGGPGQLDQLRDIALTAPVESVDEVLVRLQHASDAL